MARKKPLTADQLAELATWNIPLPATASWQVRYQLYQFVKKGNQTYGTDEATRIAFAKAATARWAGKRVRSVHGGKLGTVSHIVFRSRQNVQLTRHSRRVVASEMGESTVSDNVGAYQALVRWDGATQSTANSPQGLTIIDDQPAAPTEPVPNQPV